MQHLSRRHFTTAAAISLALPLAACSGGLSTAQVSTFISDLQTVDNAILANISGPGIAILVDPAKLSTILGYASTAKGALAALQDALSSNPTLSVANAAATLNTVNTTISAALSIAQALPLPPQVQTEIAMASVLFSGVSSILGPMIVAALTPKVATPPAVAAAVDPASMTVARGALAKYRPS